jgi:hypothetical protein
MNPHLCFAFSRPALLEEHARRLLPLRTHEHRLRQRDCGLAPTLSGQGCSSARRFALQGTLSSFDAVSRLQTPKEVLPQPSNNCWKMRTAMTAKLISALLWTAALTTVLVAQTSSSTEPLDPARDAAKLHRPAHALLTEQFIWTANDAAALRPDHAKFSYRARERKTEPHAFRGEFELEHLPSAATLYLAGPRKAKAYLNGKLVMEAEVDPNSPLASHVLRADVHSALRIGRNVLAIEAVRGRGVVAASDSPDVQQLAYGETLVAKIVPAALGVEARPLIITDPGWRSTAATPEGWTQPDFDDRPWPRVQALGEIESKADFFQWNVDAGLYDWPGYMGMSSYLRTYSLPVVAATHLIPGAGSFEHADQLTDPAKKERFTVNLPSESVDADHAPGLLVDFGREAAGRLLIESESAQETQVLVSYGESESEALNSGHFLGTNLLHIPPHGMARGPKSGLRYAWLRFVGGAPHTVLRSIQLEGIAYPVEYKGSFASSDPQLNRIWETAAQTAHMCMQDGVWDAAKRDRGWWSGDLNVSGPVIGDIFGDRLLLDETLTRLIPPARQHVNGIPGYTALWITTLADLYRHSGDKDSLQQKHAALLQLLGVMDAEFDASGQFLDKDHSWLFVDWAPGLFASTDDAVEGTELEFVWAYREGSWLLDEAGDHDAAMRYKNRAESMAAQARSEYALQNGVYGDRWQINALAVLAGVAPESDYSKIWEQVLRHAGENETQTQTISPYFNAYLLQAMARMGHRREALDWMRAYWGGMLTEGATSFWEAYDLRWPKQDPHRSLQADGATGYFVSLAHGWSAGPAAWLMEEVLGIRAADAGFHKAVIRPDLLDLDWIKGRVPTPQGAIGVAMRKAMPFDIELSLPSGVEATVFVPLAHPGADVLVNGVSTAFMPAEGGSRATIVLRAPGTYSITSR